MLFDCELIRKSSRKQKTSIFHCETFRDEMHWIAIRIVMIMWRLSISSNLIQTFPTNFLLKHQFVVFFGRGKFAGKTESEEKFIFA